MTQNEWGDIYYRATHTARNAPSKECTLKIAMYWHLTPARLHKGNKTRPPTYWRGCGEEGTLTHILWDCQVVRDYWKGVLDDIDRQFDTQIPRFPDFVLLGLPNPLTYPLKSRKGRQMGLALGTALQNILTHWGKLTQPTRLGWLHRIWHIMGMERMQAFASNSSASFVEVWRPLLSFLTRDMNEVTCPKYLRLLRLTKLEDAPQDSCPQPALSPSGVGE